MFSLCLFEIFLLEYGLNSHSENKTLTAEMLVSASGYNAKNQTVSYICLVKAI